MKTLEANQLKELWHEMNHLVCRILESKKENMVTTMNHSVPKAKYEEKEFQNVVDLVVSTYNFEEVSHYDETSNEWTLVFKSRYENNLKDELLIFFDELVILPFVDEKQAWVFFVYKNSDLTLQESQHFVESEFYDVPTSLSDEKKKEGYLAFSSMKRHVKGNELSSFLKEMVMNSFDENLQAILLIECLVKGKGFK